MRKTYQVLNAALGVLEGKATGALVRACAASSSMVVDAYFSKGAWYYLTPSEVERFTQHLGVAVQFVSVREA